MRKLTLLAIVIACVGCVPNWMVDRVTTLELRDARILGRVDAIDARIDSLHPPIRVLDIEGSISVLEGVTTFTVNGDKVYEKRNVITDTLLDEMLNEFKVGGQNFDKVQKIGLEHRYNSGSGWDSNRTWHNVAYKAGAYDTCDYVTWTYTWTCPLGWVGDTLTCFYLSHDAYVLGNEVVGEKVYAIQDTTFYLAGGGQIKIDWKLEWQAGA